MRIYIASKYLDHEIINKEIYNQLTDAGFDVFLPKSINIDAYTDEEMFIVGERCFDEMDMCDVILIVEPFGNSVSCEVGYAICQKRRMNLKKTLILLSSTGTDGKESKREAMITPYFDIVVNSIQELINHLYIIDKQQ
jgi:nucleoside 2-deoxyribosyltransferase